eukprot:936192-Pleurochrysis_carterae.AAC.1
MSLRAGCAAMAGTGRGRVSQRKGILGSRAPRPEIETALSEWLDHDQGAGSFAIRERSKCGSG